jgi:DNA-binding HxlR family transcriptional regulator
MPAVRTWFTGSGHQTVCIDDRPFDRLVPPQYAARKRNDERHTEGRHRGSATVRRKRIGHRDTLFRPAVVLSGHSRAGPSRRFALAAWFASWGHHGQVDGYSILLADCPARSALSVLSGAWAVVVLYALRDGELRYGELPLRIGGISNKVLTQTLRQLRSAGVVDRCVRSRADVRYSLTPLGRSLLGPVSALAERAHVHADEVATAQEAAGKEPTGT